MEIEKMKIGERGVVSAVDGEGAMRKRLLDMGLTPNTVVELYKRAPMGDPVELIVRGYHLTLRLSEAEHIRLRAQTEQEVAAAKAAELPPPAESDAPAKPAAGEKGVRAKAKAALAKAKAALAKWVHPRKKSEDGGEKRP